MGTENVDDQQGQQGNADDAAAAAAAAAAANNADNPDGKSADPFEALGFSDEDKDIREWITKTGFKGPKELAKSAHEQSKLLGNSIRIPGKDATQEERDAFLNKLGRPAEAKDYSFEPPKDLPDDLPYDGERANRFRDVSHKLGLTAEQAKGLHDWFATETVEDFKGLGGKRAEQQLAIAKDETSKLVKEWGPLDGEQMRTNLAQADKFLRDVGGDEAIAEFKRVGLIGDEGKIIQSAAIAKMFAAAGRALYTEDQILRGRPDRLDNPFAAGDGFNVTAQMKLIKDDRDLALSFISAAGKKPSDFGLS